MTDTVVQFLISQMEKFGNGEVTERCDHCNHGVLLHAAEHDEYGVFVADCMIESCDCSKFSSDKLGLI